jgi:hypothetical protein
MNHLRKTLLAAVCVAFTTAIPTRADSLLSVWNEVTLRAVRNSTLGPPMVARALAIIHTATYDAWVPYDEHAVGTRFGGTLRRPLAERTVPKRRRPSAMPPTAR